MKKIILHIGAHKTGTTALQHFLEKNYTSLLEKNILYPKFSDEYFLPHHLIVRPLVSPKINDYIWNLGLGDNAELKDENSIRARLLHEIESHASETIILSTECLLVDKKIFNNVVESKNKINFIKRLLSGFDVQIVIYLREPISWIESCYSEAINGAHTCYDKGFNEYLSAVGENVFDYSSYIAPWIEGFGKDKVKVRSFESAKKKGGIEKDFLELLKVNPEQFNFDASSASANVSYDGKWLHIVKEFNSINNSRLVGEKYQFPFTLEDILKNNHDKRFHVLDDYLATKYEGILLKNKKECSKYIDDIDELWHREVLIENDEQITSKAMKLLLEKLLESLLRVDAAEINEQEKEIELNAKDKELDAKDKELDAKDKELNAKDKELNAKDKELYQQRKEIELILKELETFTEENKKLKGEFKTLRRLKRFSTRILDKYLK